MIDIVNSLLRQHDFGDCKPGQVTKLKLAMANVAATMIEETSPQAARLALEVSVCARQRRSQGVPPRETLADVHAHA